MVNPSLQPLHLFERYNIVLGLRVVSIDTESQVVRLAVTECCKGEIPITNVRVSLTNEQVLAASDTLVWEGATVVAFVGKRRRRHEGDLLLYAGSGRWQKGTLEKADDLARWRWEEDLEQKMFGTFNGSSERLLEMMVDARDGRYFFPAVPCSKFNSPILVDRLNEPVRGVAMHDLDGDGRPDIYACVASGNRAYLQVAPLKFEDRTKTMGLAGAVSPSISIADVDANGACDLLVGGTIYLGSAAKPPRFSKSALLPSEAQENLKCSALADINRDGYPDVVISRRDKGLAVYLNPGKDGDSFQDASATLGLTEKDCGADVNADGRADLLAGGPSIWPRGGFGTHVPVFRPAARPGR